MTMSNDKVLMWFLLAIGGVGISFRAFLGTHNSSMVAHLFMTVAVLPTLYSMYIFHSKVVDDTSENIWFDIAGGDDDE